MTRLPDNSSLPAIPALHQETIRLLVIPFLIYLVWLVEIYLLAGSPALFHAPGVFFLYLYTIVGCVITGIIIPVIIICRSFPSGAVTMYQIGLRSIRRTGAVLPLVLVPLLILSILVVPGSGRFTFLFTFLLCLPTGIAAVMVCWALLGTHLQARVRAGGVLVSITTGVVFTAILFTLALFILGPIPGTGNLSFSAVIIGIVTAIVFFAARDIYATIIVVTAGIAYLLYNSVDPNLPSSTFIPVLSAAMIALAVLLGVHWYLSRTYSTVMVLRDP